MAWFISKQEIFELIFGVYALTYPLDKLFINFYVTTEMYAAKRLRFG